MENKIIEETIHIIDCVFLAISPPPPPLQFFTLATSQLWDEEYGRGGERGGGGGGETTNLRFGNIDVVDDIALALRHQCWFIDSNGYCL